jgi:hypothetical protein
MDRTLRSSGGKCAVVTTMPRFRVEGFFAAATSRLEAVE